tara:strand:- start:715 stop:954 length:240 start_codon:yes stop_codon:yes gene_type:complete
MFFVIGLASSLAGFLLGLYISIFAGIFITVLIGFLSNYQISKASTPSGDSSFGAAMEALITFGPGVFIFWLTQLVTRLV